MDLDHLKKLVDAAIEGSDDCAQDELEAYIREIETKAPWGDRASFGDVFEHNVRMRGEIDSLTVERDAYRARVTASEADVDARDELVRAALAWVAADKDAEIAAAAQLKAERAGDFGASPLSDRERQLADANAWLAVQCAAEQRADQAMRIAASRLAVMTAPAKDDPANPAVTLDSADSSAANRFTTPGSGNAGWPLGPAKCDGKHESPRCHDLLCWRR